MDPVLRGELPDRLLAFEDILDNLGFEGSAVVLSHSSIIHSPYFAPFNCPVLRVHYTDDVRSTPDDRWPFSDADEREGSINPTIAARDPTTVGYGQPSRLKETAALSTLG
jgi:hypothetical protein